MMQRNKKIKPVKEPLIFTNELGEPVVTGAQTEEEFFSDIREHLRKKHQSKENTKQSLVCSPADSSIKMH
jgi:hypothetical protein